MVERTTDGQVNGQVLRGEGFVQNNNEEVRTATKMFGMDGSKEHGPWNQGKRETLGNAGTPLS